MSSLPELAVRRLAAADAGPLGAFFAILAADAETARFFHPHPLTPAFAAALCARVAGCRDRYYVTHYRGRLVAYSLLRGWDEGYAVPSWGGCVHPALRGLGLGQALLAHAVREACEAGAPGLRLTVYKANRGAVHLYRKFGFVLTDKNEQELVGLLDLAGGPAPACRPPDRARLEAGIEQAWGSSERVGQRAA